MEALTTIEAVKQLAPNAFKAISDDTINALIATATAQVLADGFPDSTTTYDGIGIKIRELACKALTCHLATLDNASAQGIASEKVSVIERTYIDRSTPKWYEQRPWGQLYHMLYLEYAGGNGYVDERVILH